MNILGDKTFVIAEIGVNHEGNLAKAMEMMELATDAGADAVKFQTYIPEHYISASQPERLARVSSFCLSFDQFRQLADRAEELGVGFISTPLDFDSLDLVAEISPVIKISSGDITYFPLLKRAAKVGRTVILSTGLATTGEIDRAVEILTEGNQLRQENRLILFHCVAAYPVPEDQINLLSIPFLRERYNMPVGFSDHTLGILSCQAAVALGAQVIEKHFTYQKENQAFHDHKLSAEPDEFREMIQGIRRVEAMLGKYEKEPVEAELQFKSHIRRSLCAARDLSADDVLTEENLSYLRPETAYPATAVDEVLGRRLLVGVKRGETIQPEVLAEGAVSKHTS